LPRRFRKNGILLYGLRNQDAATLVLTAGQIMEAAPDDLTCVRPEWRSVFPRSGAEQGG
jgi:hypothetical protein